ncbi:MAG: hypothetical protein WBP79_13350 [Candidatus Acidiferrales bacterium]
MAKYKVTLRPITKEIAKAKKKLKAIRRRVTRRAQNQIDLELRSLERANRIVLIHCYVRSFPAVETSPERRK